MAVTLLQCCEVSCSALCWDRENPHEPSSSGGRVRGPIVLKSGEIEKELQNVSPPQCTLNGAPSSAPLHNLL
ncbi:hypothetical protein XELAEV_18008798mg [Xenopus laevis]|uniref:Uncharacterized protein n=1 Tax=Xenopus laevis TaxID=8355 RepID=A0A974DRJ2_XENLA|nr:hypothetical protein XELAEV_18008798mg [Xenopus laevis]